MMSGSSSSSTNIKLTEVEIKENRASAPQLTQNPIGIKQGIVWQASCRKAADVDPSGWFNGDFYGYCVPCDEFFPVDQFPNDIRRLPYGIKRTCKLCIKAGNIIGEKRVKSNGSVLHTSNGHIKTPSYVTDKAHYLQVLEDLWSQSEKSKNMSFDDYIKMGSVDKHKYIYITRWFDIPSDLRNKMDEEFSPAVEAYYVGKTNGKDSTYNGSGRSAEKLSEWVKTDYPDVKEEMRIINFASLQDAESVEAARIRETGAIQYGLNEMEGSDKAQLISIKYTLDPSIPKEYEYYNDLVNRAKETGIPKEQLAKNWGIYGNTAQLMQTANLKKAHDNGEVIVFTNS